MTASPLPRDVHTVYWEDSCVRMIDQRILPEEFRILTLRESHEVADAIRTMAVRGAPAIGISAAYGVALAARAARHRTVSDFRSTVERAARELGSTRPTAVNLFWAIERMLRVLRETDLPPVELAEALLAEARQMAEEDVAACVTMGTYGAELLPDEGNILTHCNTGSLAAVYHGTALGVIRSAVEAGKRLHVWVDETRPRLQGMRLTAWECLQLGIPATLISDNVAGSLMRQGRVQAGIVGADRIAANGDTANKIGTYGVAVLAHAHGLPFYVAAPLSTVDFSLESGDEIPIEERDPSEVTDARAIRLAPEGVSVYNPAFDVTPSRLITAIITERGIAWPPFDTSLTALRNREN